MITTPEWLHLVRQHTTEAIRVFNAGSAPPDTVPFIAVPWEAGRRAITLIYAPDNVLRWLADGGEPAMAEWLEKARTCDFEGMTIVYPPTD